MHCRIAFYTVNLLCPVREGTSRIGSRRLSVCLSVCLCVYLRIYELKVTQKRKRSNLAKYSVIKHHSVLSCVRHCPRR